MRICLIVMFVLLGGCLHVPSRPVGADGEMITIETDAGYCLRGCVRYDIRVASDGVGLLRVNRDLQRVRLRAFRLTPARYRALHDALASWRPVGMADYADPRTCDGMYSDMGGYRVEWVGRGQPGLLVVNDGCRMKQADGARASIEQAIASLRLKNLPGPSDGVAASTWLPNR